ncbi:hypothetical protein EXIGLDRAFT_719350 [Exidia glandulosa HHB12029]|uniref:Uncharacterized protein n=1 Tax=Exidia glandulosa HHB12029 TaxID=1314781 RepID=A0A165H329_EXIGL|nr:hypothetical protein EXIGLDRAFT_719350 [Exidia glandulosa HHB12029]
MTPATRAFDCNPFQLLPIELVLDIMRAAASIGLHFNRTWAVTLALVSHQIYRAVKSILHHTMVISRGNIEAIDYVCREPACDHVLQSVRRLVVCYPELSYYDQHKALFIVLDFSSLAPRFPAVAELCEGRGDSPVAPSFAQLPSCRIRRLTIDHELYGAMSTTFAGATFLPDITHLQGIWPPSFTAQQGPVRWASTILNMAPSVTHIAFRVIHLERILWADQRSRRFRPNLAVSDLVDVLRTLLGYQRIQRIAFHVAGTCVDDWPIFRRALLQIDDRRACCWLDYRRMTTYSEYERRLEESAWDGRDVWTEAHDIHTLLALEDTIFEQKWREEHD